MPYYKSKLLVASGKQQASLTQIRYYSLIHSVTVKLNSLGFCALCHRSDHHLN